MVLALLGTLVGVLTIVVGIGPRTVPDLAFHISVLIVLGWGMVVAARGGEVGPAPRRMDRTRLQ